jgi:hypothetical protein
MMAVATRTPPPAQSASPRPPPDPHPVRPREPWRHSAHVLALLGAVTAWGLSLAHIDLSHLGSYGLPPALPLLWYAALAVLVGGAVLAIWGPARPSGWVIAGYLLAIAVVLYVTIPAVASEPQYSWVYKHIGVVRFISLHGHTRASIDIYNRWPGFFALAAAFAQLAGFKHLDAYVAYAEPLYAIIALLLVGAIAHATTRNTRVAGGAALIFLLTNWVGQTYFSPQAIAYVLALTVLLIVVSTLSTSTPRERLVSLVRFIVRRPQAAAVALRPLSWSPRLSASILLALDFVIAATHQLTPYILLIQIAVLVIVGLVRPRVVLVGMGVITVGYLLPNIGFIDHHYGLFTSFDPFNNAQHASLGVPPDAGKEFNAHTSQALTYLLWVSGVVASFVLARRGLTRDAAVVFVLAFTPFAVIFGNSYGGEATLRVILFSSPGCAILIAWGLATMKRRLARLGLAAVLIGAMAALFVPAFFGATEVTIVPTADVKASEYFYAHAPPGSVLMLSSPDFPIRLAANYDHFRGPVGDDTPSLLDTNMLRYKALGPAQIPTVIGLIEKYSPSGFLVFSGTQVQYALVFRLSPPGQLPALERAVAASPRFRLWYDAGHVQIYQLVAAPTGGIVPATLALELQILAIREGIVPPASTLSAVPAFATVPKFAPAPPLSTAPGFAPTGKRGPSRR